MLRDERGQARAGVGEEDLGDEAHVADGPLDVEEHDARPRRELARGHGSPHGSPHGR